MITACSNGRFCYQYLVDCDDVIVMRDGSITEQGSHEDLMNVNGDYAAMFNTLQLGETHIIEVRISLIRQKSSFTHRHVVTNLMAFDRMMCKNQ